MSHNLYTYYTYHIYVQTIFSRAIVQTQIIKKESQHIFILIIFKPETNNSILLFQELSQYMYSSTKELNDVTCLIDIECIKLLCYEMYDNIQYI